MRRLSDFPRLSGDVADYFFFFDFDFACFFFAVFFTAFFLAMVDFPSLRVVEIRDELIPRLCVSVGQVTHIVNNCRIFGLKILRRLFSAVFGKVGPFPANKCIQ